MQSPLLLTAATVLFVLYWHQHIHCCSVVPLQYTPCENMCLRVCFKSTLPLQPFFMYCMIFSPIRDILTLDLQGHSSKPLQPARNRKKFSNTRKYANTMCVCCRSFYPYTCEIYMRRGWIHACFMRSGLQKKNFWTGRKHQSKHISADTKVVVAIYWFYCIWSQDKIQIETFHGFSKTRLVFTLLFCTTFLNIAFKPAQTN